MHVFNILGGGVVGKGGGDWGEHFQNEVSEGIKIDNPSTITLGRSIFFPFIGL